jgi:hypothetical protein
MFPTRSHMARRTSTRDVTVAYARNPIGLTRRRQDDATWVMGQAVLRNHSIRNQEKDSVGFWCDAKTARPGLPSNNSSLASKLSRAVHLRRKSEPGLSLVIPGLLPEITSDHLIAATIRNYYFPILTGRLIVEIDDVEVSEHTFEQVSRSLPSELVPRSLLGFVRQLKEARAAEPTLVLPIAWQSEGISADTIGEETADDLRQRYKDGKLVFVRAPLKLKLRGENRRQLSPQRSSSSLSPLGLRFCRIARNACGRINPCNRGSARIWAANPEMRLLTMKTGPVR